MTAAVCFKTESDLTMSILAGDRQHSILLDGQVKNLELPTLRECISHKYSQARWLYELPGMAVDPDSDEWTEGVRDIQIPQKHRGIRTGINRQGPPHIITSIQAESATARNGNVLVGELINHIDLLPTNTMNHVELHRALQGPMYTSVSLGICDPLGNAQTISVLRSLSKTSQISWARALKPLRDRRLALQKTTSSLTKDEEKELVSLSLGEAAFLKFWPKLRARGFNTLEFISRLNPTIARTRFSCPILGTCSADTADTLLPTDWLNNLCEVEGHIASLELSQARPTLLPSTGGSQESLMRRQRTLTQLEIRAEAVAHRMTALDSSSTLLETCIPEIREACSGLYRGGA